MENIPQFKALSEEDRQRIREEMGIPQFLQDEAENKPIPEPEVRPHRGRGRPRKYQRDEFGRVLKDKPIVQESSGEEPQALLPPPPLTSRDTKEIAKRLSGIFIGATSVGAVLNPHIQMTPKEADDIAVPLTAYLARTEATSRIARQVLDEYDLAAFVIATLAYMIRVVRDVQRDREVVRNESISEGRKPRGLQRADSSQRIAEPTAEQIVSESNGENEAGLEREVDRGWASIAPKLRNPTEV